MPDHEPVIRSLPIDGADLQYLEYEGDGPPLILLHATGFLPWLWHPIARELAGPYRVIAPYFCDHRDAEPETGGLSWRRLAADLAALCAGLRLERPFMAGHSMGATVMAIANAVSGRLAEKLILIEPIFLPENLYGMRLRVEDHPLASKTIRRRNQWRDAAEARDYLRGKGLFKDWDQEMLDLYLRHGMVEGGTGGLELACSPRREAALFMGGMHLDPWPLLPRVACPVLVLEGGESQNRLYINLQRAVSLFPDGRLQVIPGAGHLIPMEKPGEIIRIIREFFGGAEGGRPIPPRSSIPAG